MRKITWKIYLKSFYFILIFQRIHHFFISLKKNPNETKIFCIGSSKTGTNSIIKGLKILGYRSFSFYEWPTIVKKGEDAYLEKIKKSSYDAFADWPFGDGDFYKKIDKTIPKSKFILTIRNRESLQKSWTNYFKNSPRAKKRLENISEKMDEIEKRNKEIINYFKDDKSKLLLIKITEGEGWDKLCKFLDKPIPNMPFPHKNVGKYKKKNEKKSIRIFFT